MNINVSINPSLAKRMKEKVARAGYSNTSEYIRDILRHDLKLAHEDSYAYDMSYIHQLNAEATTAFEAGETKRLTTMEDLLS